MPGSEHAHRYFDWEWRDGEFHYFEHAVNFAREKVSEGKYVMQTEESDLAAEVLRAVGLTPSELNPPTPPAGQETLL